MQTYAQALAALYQRVDWERQRRRQPEALRLTPVRRLLERLGNPQHRFAVLHVAGTKGKGSTAAMLEAVLRAAGYRTGLYTSPHLHTVRERIRIQGEPLPPEAFRDSLRELWPWVEADDALSVFDVLTGLAFQAFAQAGVEVAVVEVGLGGRLDSTNVVAPSLSVLTRLGLDHTDVLGGTLRRVAYEKAGIIKPGVPVLSAPQRPEALQVLRRVAADRGAALYVVPAGAYAVLQATPEGQRVRLPTLAGKARIGHMALVGIHQAENAALVSLAVDLLRDRGWRLDETALWQGLTQVGWPGRFEVLDKDRPLVVDGAHTPDAARALARTLRLVFPGRRWRVLLGFSQGKDMTGFLKTLTARVPVVDIWATASRHPRAVAAEVVGEAARGWSRDFRVVDDVETALRQALQDPWPLLVTGSLFVVAEAREAWAALGHMPMPPQDPEIQWRV